MLRAIVKTTPNIKGQKCTYFFGWDFGFAMGWGIVGGFRIGEGRDFGGGWALFGYCGGLRFQWVWQVMGLNRFWVVGDFCWIVESGLLGYQVDAGYNKKWNTKRR